MSKEACTPLRTLCSPSTLGKSRSSSLTATGIRPVSLNEAAAKLKLAGAEGIILCTNTMQFVSHGIEKASQVPLIHIADPMAERILKAGFKTVGLLGTCFTMEGSFDISRLEEKFGLSVIVPEEIDRLAIHDVFYTELCKGILQDTSRQVFYDVVTRLAKVGAQCIVLGCTETELLICKDGSVLPVFDATKIHAIAANHWAMKGNGQDGKI